MNLEMAREWLRSASDDLVTIKEIIHNDSLTQVVAFHSQQCVEKSIKAVLEYHEADVPKTHSVLKLAKLVERYLDINDKEMADELDKLYIDARYPGDFGLLPDGKPPRQKAVVFYDFAKRIYQMIEGMIDSGEV